jgi:hypothetical protein
MRALCARHGLEFSLETGCPECFSDTPVMVPADQSDRLRAAQKAAEERGIEPGCVVYCNEAVIEAVAGVVDHGGREPCAAFADPRASLNRILQPAGIDATLAERGSRYGSFDEHARITQAIKAAMIDSPNWARLAPDQREALEMVAHKVGRILNGDPDYHDSWHDIVGYTKLVADRLEAEP